MTYDFTRLSDQELARRINQVERDISAYTMEAELRRMYLLQCLHEERLRREKVCA